MRLHISVYVLACVCMCLCGFDAAVSFWAVYGSYTLPSSSSSASHVIIQAAVIGWERSRRGRRAGMDGQREGSAIEGGKERRGVGRRGMSNVRSKHEQ